MRIILLRNNRSWPLLGVLGILLPVLPACNSGSRGSEGRTADADSLLRGIMESVAQTNPQPAPQTSSGSPRLSPQERASRPLEVKTMGYNDGSPEAPLKVLELSDFACGYCRRFHLETYPKLRETYIEPGFVEWKYVPVSIGFPNGLQAAIAGECAGEQNRFPAMRVRLFEEQGTWRGTDDPSPVFSEMAGEEGLDVERFNACVDGGWRDGRVRDNLRLRGELGVEGTPTFIIDGRALPGAQPLETFRDILDAALRRMGVEPPKHGGPPSP